MGLPAFFFSSGTSQFLFVHRKIRTNKDDPLLLLNFMVRSISPGWVKNKNLKSWHFKRFSFEQCSATVASCQWEGA